MGRVILSFVQTKSYENDSTLVDRCLKGDFTAWANLATKYAPLIDTSIRNASARYGLGLSRQDAEDARQEMLARIWQGKKLDTVRNKNDISYWIAVVSANSALEYARKIRSREPVRPSSVYERIGEKELLDFIPSVGATPSEELIGKETLEEIRSAIEGLSCQEKLVTKLYLLHRKQYEEISKILRIPTGTVSSHINRARTKLQKKLKYLQ